MTDARPSKKQRELLNFIDGFIKENGYNPSYREIMRALDYKSVSTVAVHIDGLIVHGLLRKTDHSARSLEVVGGEQMMVKRENAHIEWLKKEIEKRAADSSEAVKAEAETLRQALAIVDRTI